jgi:glycosyltransferase involved in cell wall biosynthesis
MNPTINKNNSKNLISVIIVFFNAEKFIQEAIESVFAQTYSNWELLLIDDGSTDGSTKIARQCAEQYPQKVTYLEHANHKNLGAAAARNLGINKSNGEYVTFLDADDVWLQQQLNAQMVIMRAYPDVAVTYGHIFYWYSWTGKPDDKRRDRVDRLRMKQEDCNTIIKPPDLLKKWVKCIGASPGMSCVIVRREALERIGGFEESIPVILDDQVFFVKIFAGEPVFVASQIWSKYRQHQDSSCSSIDKQKHCAISLRFWKWVKQYLANKRIKDEEMVSIIEERIQRRRLGQLN